MGKNRHEMLKYSFYNTKMCVLSETSKCWNYFSGTDGHLVIH